MRDAIRKKRKPKARRPAHMKDKLDTYDLHQRYGLSQAQIRKLAGGDEPVIRGDRSTSRRWATTWDEIFRVEGWLTDGRELSAIERQQAMERPLTPKEYACHPHKDGPQCEEDSVRKAIREGRQVGVFKLGERYYLRAAWVVKLGPGISGRVRHANSAPNTHYRRRSGRRHLA